METLGATRQPAVGRRFDFETPVAWHATCARIVMTDVGSEIDVAAAINRGLHLLTPAETPFAFDHGIGCVDAVNDDGHAGAARNHDVEAAAGKGRPRRCDQNRQCQASAHGFVLPASRGNLTERASLKVKAADQSAGKPNASAFTLAQLQATAMRKC